MDSMPTKINCLHVRVKYLNLCADFLLVIGNVSH